MEITSEQLEAGIDMSYGASFCLDSMHCLFDDPKNIPKWWFTSGDRCTKDGCSVLIFRKIFERESPAFFGKFLELSKYGSVIHDYRVVELEGGTLMTNKDVQRRIKDLYTFSQLVFVALFPLFLANNGMFPLLSGKEIRRIEKDYYDGKVDELEDMMIAINRDWPVYISFYCGDITDDEKYDVANGLLIYIFFEGIAKETQLPDLTRMPGKEKETFFNEVEKKISEDQN